jgi:hypothetical protein
VDALEDWVGDAWVYDEEYGEYVYGYNVPGYSLMSKCVPLEADRTYTLDMAYWAVQNEQYDIYTSFDVLIGKSGDAVDSFEILASYNRVQTESEDPIDYDTVSFEFSVGNPGDYVLSVMPTEFFYDDFYALFGITCSYLGLRYINVAEKPSVGVVLANRAVNNLNIYPIPVSTVLTVDGVRNGKVSIVDMTGRTVMQRNIGSARMLLNVQNLPDGVYTLHSGSQAVKFIKKQ